MQSEPPLNKILSHNAFAVLALIPTSVILDWFVEEIYHVDIKLLNLHDCNNNKKSLQKYCYRQTLRRDKGYRGFR